MKTTSRAAVERRSNGTDRLWGVVTVVALLGVATLGALVVIEGFERLQAALGLGGTFAITFAVGGLLATFWYGLVGYVYLRVRDVEIHYGLRVPTLRDAGWVVGGLVTTIVASLAVSVVAAATGAGEPTNISAAAAGTVDNPLVLYGAFLVAIFVFIAPIEEFLFRGIVQGLLRESFGPVAAIGLTAIGFALTHVPSYWFGGSDLLSPGVGFALLGIAAGAVILGAIYERTDSLLIVTLIHALINTVGIALVVAPML